MEVIALIIIFSWLAITTIVAALAGIIKKFSLEEWTVASREIRAIVMYFALAAEIYSAFTFLGLAGWAFSYGYSIYYAPAYFTTAYCTGFLLARYYWTYSKRFSYITQADYFADRYESRLLGVIVAIIGVLALLPYIQLQITGVGIIVESASYGAIDRTTAFIIAFLCTAVFIFIGGARGILWTNVLQGVLMFVCAFIVLGVPIIGVGGIDKLFDVISREFPSHLVPPGAKAIHPIQWYMSSLLLTTLGFWMFPHLVMRVYAAKSPEAPMRSTALMPWYSILAFPIILAGYSALILVPGLRVADMAVMETIKIIYPATIVGLVGAGGLAAAVSTGGGLIQASAAIIARNWIQRGLWPKASDVTTAWIARSLTLIITIVSLLLALYAPALLVYLLLVAYSFVVQFFPGTVFGYIWRKATKAGVMAGILIGCLVVILTSFVWKDPYGVHSGIWGLAANFAVTIPVCMVTKLPSQQTLNRFFGE
ncbi:MAG: sodium:solute symporter family protein [Sulfolobales archaeon]